MPIYAYRCRTCGHAQDVLRKVSDPPLTVCPACGAATFVKQVTAAGFQLKGSGWYVTDFRDGNKKPGPAVNGDVAAKEGAAASGEPTTAPNGDAASTAAKPAEPAAASAPAPAPTAAPAPAPADKGRA